MINLWFVEISSSIFVGRIAERAQLEAGVLAAEYGEPGIALLGGDAGIGKTRLATELAGVAVRRGGRVAYGHCLEADAAGMAFAPFVEVLRGLLLGDRAHDLASPQGPGRAALARLVPEIERQPATEPRRSTSDEQPIQLFHAVLELVSHVRRGSATDRGGRGLHWADASSL